MLECEFILTASNGSRTTV